MHNRLGAYQLLERIGHGTTGRVWRARDSVSGAEVAIKVLREELADDSDLRARFLQEGRLLVDNGLPGAVRVRESVIDGDRVGLVMDLVEGPNLREVISAGAPLRPARACALAGQVAAGLAAAHERGMVHRDVKPENVLVETTQSSERALLSDFGLACALDESGTRSTRSRAFGTPDYVAPERIRRAPVGAAADVYAVGILLFEMVVGWRPFRSRDAAALMQEHLHEQPSPPPEIDRDLWAVIEQCLAKDPAGRPKAADLARRLQALATSLSDSPALALTDPPTDQAETTMRRPPDGTETDPTRTKVSSRGRRVLVAALAACALAAGSVAASGVVSSPSSSPSRQGEVGSGPTEKADSKRPTKGSAAEATGTPTKPANSAASNEPGAGEATAPATERPTQKRTQPSTEEPAPAPRTREPAPAPRTREPAPRTREPAPPPRTREPAPPPRTREPAPAPRTREPAPPPRKKGPYITTRGGTLNEHVSPKVSSPVIRRIANGDEIELTCWTTGDGHVWDRSKKRGGYLLAENIANDGGLPRCR